MGPDFVGFEANHLGGETGSALWVVDVDVGERGSMTGEYEKVYCKSADIFFCNARLSHSSPQPATQEGDTLTVIGIRYRAKNID